MARRPTRAQLRRQFAQLAQEWEPRFRDAFFAAVADVANRAELGRIIERLERGDIAGAIEAVHLDAAAFRTLETSMAGAYGAGGQATVGSIPALRDPFGGMVVLRFDIRSPRAEAWLADHAAGLVTRIVEDQRSALQTTLTQGMIDGRNPRAVALDIVGRVAPGSNSRSGGLLGLSGPQAQAVDRARAGLLSGDATAMRDYLNLSRRDRRFDSTVLKAISERKPLDAATVSRITGRYSDRLLQLRGETIARTEMLAALAQSKDEAFRQAIDTGAISGQQVMKVWRATADARTRDSHAALNGESVRMDQPFSNGLMHPHDPSAPPEEVINCRCDLDYVVDFLAGLE